VSEKGGERNERNERTFASAGQTKTPKDKWRAPKRKHEEISI
jgi:hypothetical protein